MLSVRPSDPPNALEKFQSHFNTTISEIWIYRTSVAEWIVWRLCKQKVVGSSPTEKEQQFGHFSLFLYQISDICWSRNKFQFSLQQWHLICLRQQQLSADNNIWTKYIFTSVVGFDMKYCTAAKQTNDQDCDVYAIVYMEQPSAWIRIRVAFNLGHTLCTSIFSSYSIHKP